MSTIAVPVHALISSRSPTANSGALASLFLASSVPVPLMADGVVKFAQTTPALLNTPSVPADAAISLIVNTDALSSPRTRTLLNSASPALVIFQPLTPDWNVVDSMLSPAASDKMLAALRWRSTSAPKRSVWPAATVAPALNTGRALCVCTPLQPNAYAWLTATVSVSTLTPLPPPTASPPALNARPLVVARRTRTASASAAMPSPAPTASVNDAPSVPLPLRPAPAVIAVLCSA